MLMKFEENLRLRVDLYIFLVYLTQNDLTVLKSA